MASIERYTREFGRNTSIALPVMLGYLGHVAVGIVDNIFVGWLDPVNLAAVSLANSALFFIMSFGIGFSYAITPLVSEAEGSGKKLRMKKILYNGLFLNTATGLIMVAMSMLIPPFLRWANQPPEVVELAVPYVRIVGFSLLFVMIFQAYKQFSDGLGRTLYPMISTLIANVLNVIISYVLIFGKLGIAPMGIYGAAYGTLTARVLTTLIIHLYVRMLPVLSVYSKGINRKLFSLPVIRKMLSLGIPSGFQGVFEMGIFSATVWIAGTLGSVAQAANQIALQIASLSFMVFIGFGVTATIRVGNMKGKNDFAGLKRIAVSVLLQVFLFELLFTLSIILLRYELPHFFLSEYNDPGKEQMAAEIYRTAVHLLVIVGFFQIADGFQVVLQGVLRGLQDVVIPFYLTFISYWVVAFPVSWLLSRRMGAGGIWYGLLTGLSLASVFLGLRLFALLKKTRGQIPKADSL